MSLRGRVLAGFRARWTLLIELANGCLGRLMEITVRNRACYSSERKQRDICMQNNTLRFPWKWNGNRERERKRGKERGNGGEREGKKKGTMVSSIRIAWSHERFGLPRWRAMTGCSTTSRGERAHESLNTWAKLQGSMPNYETFIRLVDVHRCLATKTRVFRDRMADRMIYRRLRFV